MAQYIDREELLKTNADIENWREPYGYSIFAIKQFPIASVEPVQHGTWKYFHKQGIAVCTNCSFKRKLDDDFGRAISCPNCGAKMQ